MSRDHKDVLKEGVSHWVHSEMSDPQAVTGLLVAKHHKKRQSLGAKDDVHPRVGDHSLAQFTHLSKNWVNQTFISHL